MAKTTKAHDIQTALAADIVHGRRAPGTALDETQLARDFAVSRTPVREALRQLEVSGLVEARPHRGAVVCDVSAERLGDMFAVMGELEAVCARGAAGAMAGPARAALRALHDGSAALVERGDRDGYVRFNELFHDAIYDGAANGFLAEITRQVRARLSPFRREQLAGHDRAARSFDEHARIVACIERGDPGAAEAEMRAHMAAVRAEVGGIDRGAG